MTKHDMEQALVGMVVDDSLPLSFFSQSQGFERIAGPIASELKVSLDRDNIRRLVLENAERDRKSLINVLRRKPLFLKMDGATRMNCSC